MSGEDKNNTNNFNMNDPHSVYYLCSADHPGNIISTVTLNGDNYANWSRIVMNALKSENKFCFVDGSLAKPEKNPVVHAWGKCNSMVVAWLYNVIDKTLHGSVAYAEKASEIWTDLKERYSQGNEIRVHQLKIEIHLATQDNMNVTKYFTKLKTLC